MARRPFPAAPAELLDLLRAARQAPREDTLRQVVADWLEEHGQDERAEFVRAQIERSQLAPDDPRQGRLALGEQALLERHGSAWLGPLHGVIDRWDFRGGMLHVLGDLSGLLRRGTARLLESEAWAWVVRLRSAAVTYRQVEKLAGCPLLQTVAALDLAGAGLGYLAGQLVTSPHLGGLDLLDLSWNGLDPHVVEALVTSGHVPRLTRLFLTGNRLNDRTAAALGSWPGLSRLAELQLGDNQIGDPGARALAGSAYLTPLTLLDLRNNPIRPGGWSALRERMGDSVLS
jgi:uncharacterized protein (TIGR02996 family)